jgi:hypothetical protein
MSSSDRLRKAYGGTLTLAELTLRLAELREHRARLLATPGREGERPSMTHLLAHANMRIRRIELAFRPGPAIRSEGSC